MDPVHINPLVRDETNNAIGKTTLERRYRSVRDVGGDCYAQGATWPNATLRNAKLAVCLVKPGNKVIAVCDYPGLYKRH
jgi:hypothetical protein